MEAAAAALEAKEETETKEAKEQEAVGPSHHQSRRTRHLGLGRAARGGFASSFSRVSVRRGDGTARSRTTYRDSDGAYRRLDRERVRDALAEHAEGAMARAQQAGAFRVTERLYTAPPAAEGAGADTMQLADAPPSNNAAVTPPNTPVSAVPKAPKVRALGPAWTRGEIEKPAGERDMGGWTALFYTEEQQARLGVNEQGKKVVKVPLTKAAAPAPAPAPPAHGDEGFMEDVEEEEKAAHPASALLGPGVPLFEHVNDA